jgi:hypothetical protein
MLCDDKGFACEVGDEAVAAHGLNVVVDEGRRAGGVMSWLGWGQTHPGIDLLAAVSPARARVIAHPLYVNLNTHAAITTFMEHHVFAVWDFMSLLKSLQRNLTCVTVPWVPTGPTGSRRLINEIVLAEESDELRGGHISHFEWYVAGMTEAGAEHSVVDRFIELIRAGEPVLCALRAAGVPPAAAEFVSGTWGFIESGPVHCQAAAFAFGREELIPDMFAQVFAVNQDNGGLETFVAYLERHIEVDGEAHTPMAMQMLADLCGRDEVKWQECTETATAALAARSRLWDGILTAIAAQRGVGAALDITDINGVMARAR